MLITLKAHQGKTVIVDGNVVRIVKKGGIFASKREKTLPIKSITSVEVKKPGMMTVGFIQFSTAGSVARNSSFTLTGGSFDAVQDENSATFRDKAEYQTALLIKQYIDNFAQLGEPLRLPQVSGADEILKYKKLMDEGVLSKEEFEVKKRQLLGL